jgi:ArsR family transcriptional regulator, arsenate/arsenite/antimonite-responsive transcriptional repressor
VSLTRQVIIIIIIIPGQYRHWVIWFLRYRLVNDLFVVPSASSARVFAREERFVTATPVTTRLYWRDMKTTLVSDAQLAQAARRFRLLGEPTRLELLNLLHARGEMNVQDLVEASGQSQANVSKHLRLLLDEGLVGRRRDGPFSYYRIADPTLAALCMLVCGQLSDPEHKS